MTNLADMNARMQQWMGEKPSFDFGNELRLNKGDIVIFQFIANGDDGDRFIKPYRSHVLNAKSKAGKDYNTHRYCPVKSGESDLECSYCQQGLTDIKERFSMWMWVSNIFRATMPVEQQLKQVQWENAFFFNEEINNFRIWHTSAWRESPWADINTLYGMYKGLHNFTAQIKTVGDGRDRRYKLYAIPNTAGLPQETYTKAMDECQPIPEILHSQLASLVAVNPQVSNEQPGVGQNIVEPFNLPGISASVPNFEMPGNSPAQPAVVQEQNSEPENALVGRETQQIQEEEQKRPLKSLF